MTSLADHRQQYRVRWSRHLCTICLVAVATGAAADTKPPRGIWGTAEACQQWQAGEPDTAAVGPYEIGDQWIRRWQFYCFILAEHTLPETDTRWELAIICGEGATQQRYRLQLELGADDRLIKTWQMDGERDTYPVGPLERCDKDEPGTLPRD